MPSYLLAVDSGSTATKVVLYDLRGRTVAAGVEATPRDTPAPGRVERDPDAHWARVAGLVRQVVAESGIPAAEIAAIGLAAQGDGLHLIDAAGRPVRPAILSSDARASGVVERWRGDGTLDALRELTGQIPFPGSPAPLLRWLDEVEPETLARTRWALASKDWLRFRMTGEILTDRTDAGASFADADTHRYSEAALVATGLEHLGRVLPPLREPAESAGGLTVAAAAQLGLPPGVPVAVGLHDVAAAIVGSVGLDVGRLCVIAGTFGVNAVLTPAPLRSPLLNSRPGPTPELWSVRRTSRASIANVEWMAGVLTPGSGREEATREAVIRALDAPVAADVPFYVPFLFGGNPGQPDSAAFLGLRSWHEPASLLRGVVEGVTFNHRHDVELIAGLVPVTSVHLSGGAVRNPAWRQLFADVFGRPLTVADEGDAGARGAAMCAAVVAGAYPDLAAASAAMRPGSSIVEPGPASPGLDERYRVYLDAVDRLTDFDERRAAAAAPIPLLEGR